MASWWTSYIARGARARGLDPRAVLAVAAQEGLSGRAGDQGTSFGPFQLHVGGALPRGRGRAWAESPAGIDYALNQIAGIARGQRGGQAISSIVSRFERPANVGAEVAGASRAYGGPISAGGGSGFSAPSFGGGGQPNLRALALGLIAANQASSQHRQPDYSALLGSLSQTRGAPVAHMQNAAAVHNGNSLSYLEPFGRRFGLQITSTTGGEHVANSYHYRGRAVDFAGNPGRMMALMQYALAHPAQFTEAFYDPAGYYVKNGKVIRGAIGGHGTHVHLAR